MAFVRGSAGQAVYVLPLTSDVTPAGSPSQVTPEVPAIMGLAWTPGARGLVFSASGHLGGLPRLQRINLASNRLESIGAPESLPFGEQATWVSISRTGRLVYSAQVRDTNIWKLSLTGDERFTSVPIVRSTYDEHTPDYSWDGKRLAFTSTRTGTEEIFIADADGSNAVQRTFTGGPVSTNPRWSPNGQTLVFQSLGRKSYRELNLLHTGSGAIERLTDDDSAADTQANWSRDRRWLYFASDRTGRWEIWKMPAARGAYTQVTRQGGLHPIESRDGRFLYYAKFNASPLAIWRVPVDGGEETLVVEGLSLTDNFAVADDGLYFLASGERPGTSKIDFFEFKTANRQTLVELSKPAWWGMALSADQKSLLYSVVDSAGADLMLVDKIQ